MLAWLPKLLRCSGTLLVLPLLTLPGPAQSRADLALAMRELRAADAAPFPDKVRALLSVEAALVSSFRNRLMQPETRPEVLLEIEDDDAELAAAVRAALPAGPADEATAGRALEPWIARFVTRPADQELARELGLLADRCEEAERAILRIAPNDTVGIRKQKEEAVLRWDASRERALAAIFDVQLYPDQDGGSAGQGQVDERVGAAWNDYKAMADRVDEDLVPLFRKKPEEWKALLEQLTAAQQALDESLPLIATRAGVRVAPRASDDSARMRLGRALLLCYLDRAVEARSLLAGDARYEAELARHVHARLVLDLNAARMAGAPRDAQEDRAERWINEYRVALGRLPLEYDSRLHASARGHCAEMSALDYYGHESPVAERRTFADRIRLAGYPESRVGECLARVAANWTGSRVARSWYDSSVHHRLMLSEDFRQIGVGRDGLYFTANFGSQHTLGR